MVKFNRIYSIFLISILGFGKNLAMEKPCKKIFKVHSLIKLTSLKIAKNAEEIYNNEFKKNKIKAFKATENYLKNTNLPNDIIKYIYHCLIANLNRADIFIRELLIENSNLTLFFNLCFKSRSKLTYNLIDSIIIRNTNHSDLFFKDFAFLLNKILKHYNNEKFDNLILKKLNATLKIANHNYDISKIDWMLEDSKSKHFDILCALLMRNAQIMKSIIETINLLEKRNGILKRIT